MKREFELSKYYNCKTDRSRFIKEFDDGRQVRISWRRYKKMLKGWR